MNSCTWPLISSVSAGSCQPAVSSPDSIVHPSNEMICNAQFLRCGVDFAGVSQDDLLRDLFADMAFDHPHRVALLVSEVLGGPAGYSETRGGHATMVSQHICRTITEEERQRWMQLLLSTADGVRVPSDPEFRSALVAYLEWGTRLALANAKLPQNAELDSETPMPKWGWGLPRRPLPRLVLVSRLPF